MVVKIHGMKQSTCTQRVSTVLKELGVAYEIVPINFAAGEHKSEAYIKNLQPFGQVPVLVRFFRGHIIGKKVFLLTSE